MTSKTSLTITVSDTFFKPTICKFIFRCRQIKFMRGFLNLLQLPMRSLFGRWNLASVSIPVRRRQSFFPHRTSQVKPKKWDFLWLTLGRVSLFHSIRRREPRSVAGPPTLLDTTNRSHDSQDKLRILRSMRSCTTDNESLRQRLVQAPSYSTPLISKRPGYRNFKILV